MSREVPSAPKQTPESAEEMPGLKLGKIGMILAIIPFTAFLGLCVSVLATVISRQARTRNRHAVIGIVVSVVWLVVGVIASSLFYMQS